MYNVYKQCILECTSMLCMKSQKKTFRAQVLIKYILIRPNKNLRVIPGT